MIDTPERHGVLPIHVAGQTDPNVRELVEPRPYDEDWAALPVAVRLRLRIKGPESCDTSYGITHDIRQAKDLLDAQQRTIEGLRDVLENVQHGVGCPAQPGWLDAEPCTCGLDAALSQSSQAGEGTPLNSTQDKKP